VNSSVAWCPFSIPPSSPTRHLSGDFRGVSTSK
jgi:hypothetical protein